MGVILYTMLCGYPPFYDENNTKLFQLITNIEYDFGSPYWDNISESAKDLIRHILTKDPAIRYSADQILNHPWLNGEEQPEVELTSVSEQLKEYIAKKRLKKAAVAIMAVGRLKKLNSKMF